MNFKALAAEAFGTFMLMSAVLGAALHASGGAAGSLGAYGILAIAISIGLTVMVLTRTIGHISGGHYNPAVTLGLVAGGRFPISSAAPYILAQCTGALVACLIFSRIGASSAAVAASEFAGLSMVSVGPVPAFLIETILTLFFLIVIMGATRSDIPSTYASLAIGLSLTAIYIIAMPITNASVNPARSLGSAVFAGGEALTQLWLFWAAPILGGVLGATMYNWMVAGEEE